MWPYLDVEPRRYRFLFLNGSNARTYEMFFVNTATKVTGPVMWVIGNDGGILDWPSIIDPNAAKPVEPHFIIMPGERYDRRHAVPRERDPGAGSRRGGLGGTGVGCRNYVKGASYQPSVKLARWPADEPSVGHGVFVSAGPMRARRQLERAPPRVLRSRPIGRAASSPREMRARRTLVPLGSHRRADESALILGHVI